jgi:hypothetical protein
VNAAVAVLERPIFIVAAPRSGSSLLYETLAASHSLCTVGGEAHWLIESLPTLRPGSPGIDSNRLTADSATPAVIAHMHSQLAARVIDAHGRPVLAGSPLRLLEKTPKNALRVPFLDRAFRDAMFVFLWRDPRESVSSIMQAWKAGRWRTYPWLEGFPLPWSLLLPPGWERLRGRPLEEIAAYQWESANRTALDDLERIPDRRWIPVEYRELVSAPAAVIERICAFAGLDVDAGLLARLAQPLPLARHTLTPPAVGKWQHDAAAVERVLPAIEPTWRRLLSLGIPGTRSDRSPAESSH